MRKTYLILSGLVLMLVLTGASCISRSGSDGPMGIYKSLDKGESWQQASIIPTKEGVGTISGLKVYRIYNDPSDANAMYLTTRGQGAYYTYDNAETWNKIDVFAGKWIYALVVDPKDKCTIYASDGVHIYKTVDCSRTWKLVYTEERVSTKVQAMSIDYGDSNLIYAAEDGGDILLSSDAGSSWRVVSRLNTTLRDLRSDPYQSKRLFVATRSDGLKRSDDSGFNWVDLKEGFKEYSGSNTFYRLYLHPSLKDSLFWVSKYGILRSDDSGDTWASIDLLTPPGSVNIYGFGINPINEKEMYYTGTILGEKSEHVRSTFYKSTDGGVNWVTKKLPTNSVPGILNLQPDSGNILFLGFTNLES